MEEKVKGEGAEVQKRRYQSPVLVSYVSQLAACIKEQSRRASHLILHEYSSEAIEELEWRNDMTLD